MLTLMKTMMHALRARHDVLSDRLARRVLPHMSVQWRARRILGAQVIDLDWYRDRTGRGVASISEAALELASRGDVPANAVNPLFDADWYGARAGVAGSTGDRLLHYLVAGEAAGHAAGPWFSPAFFRRFNNDYSRYGSLLGAYMHGWRENPQPHPHFDGAWYVWRYPDVGVHWPRSPLDHFVRAGIAEGREPNMCFATRWYLHSYPDVAASGQAPAEHFNRSGAAELRSPGPNFDMRAYQAYYASEIAASGLDPLAHYLRLGRDAGHTVGTRYTELSDLLRSTVPVPRAPDARAVVDVIVPVYRDLDVTRGCIVSLLDSVPHHASRLRIRIHNDASPEPAVTAFLRELAATGQVLLVENAQNQGFVRTVNDGMRMALAEPDCRAVVLLNSDTEVSGDWVDRLMAHGGNTDVGSVTALSNNATICSYPAIGAFDLPRWSTTAQMDAAAWAANAGRSVEIPTAVGFCMLIPRLCLERTGLFDEDAFGRGYGEENDFCMRARALGMHHLLATDVFVRHVGEVSFAGDSAPGKEVAGRIIRERYPLYDSDVARHCAADPARLHRVRMTFARWRAAQVPVTLLCTHDLGGGTERQVQRVAAELRQTGHVVIMRPGFGHKTLLRFENTCPEDAFDFVVDPGGAQALADLLLQMGVRHVQLHHLYDHGDSLREALALSGLPHSFDVHDYYVICPQITLTTVTQEYCGEPPPSGCDACIAERPSLGASDIRNWRTAHGWTVLGATSVRAPSMDTAQRIERHFGVPVAVTYHEVQHDAFAPVARRTRPITPDDPVRVVLLGVLSLTKGRRKVFEAIEACERLGLAVHVHVIGDPQDMLPAVAPGRFSYTGWYKPAQLPELIAQAQADMYLFASAAPETYSFTLTEAMHQRRPIMATDLGAFAERLRGYPDHALYPHAVSGEELARRLWDYATAGIEVQA